MAIEALRDFVGEWELELPGTGRIRGHVVFEDLGDVLVQRTSIPNFFSPLDFCQRYVGTFSNDRTEIDGEWQTSADGHDWQQDFPLRHRRISPSR